MKSRKTAPRTPSERRPLPASSAPTGPVVLGALVVGVAILAGSWMVKSSLDATVAELGAIRTGLTQTQQALEKVARNRGAEPTDQRKGLDPNKRYTIDTRGAPRKGPSSAKVQLVEFSDFQ